MNLALIFPFLRWWPQVNRTSVRNDAMAGLTGALIVLPQGVAFATIAGLPAQYGLYAAMVPAIIAALWGSSTHLVSGPTTAISIAVFAALSRHAAPGSPEYIQLAITLTFWAGVFQLTLGLARMGALINFISHSVVVGFTAGAAILILASQTSAFFGLDIPRGTPFYGVAYALLNHWGEIKPYVLTISVATLVSGILARRYLRQIPYMVVAMILGSTLAFVLNFFFDPAHTGIRTVGALPGAFPALSFPDFSLDAAHKTLSPALAVALLALTEAVSIARSIAVRSEQIIDGNQEFIGQGLSNVVGSFFSAYASSGSFNRSGVNFEAGAQTPLASVFAAFMLVIVLLLVAPLAAHLPTAAMAGILWLVAWGLIDTHHIREIWITSKPESLILVSTLIFTLFNLEMGIFLGVFLSLVMFLYRSSRPEMIPVVPAADTGAYHFVRAQGHPECPQLRILRLNGALYFGAANYVQQALRQIDEDNPQTKSVLLVAGGITYVDIAGAEALAQEARRRRRIGGGLYFYRLPSLWQNFLKQGHYAHDIGEGAFFPVRSKVTSALYWTLNPDICRRCQTRIFPECTGAMLPNGFRRLRLMLATHGEPHTLSATRIAVGLAQQYGVTLDVLTVLAPSADEQQAQQGLNQARECAQAAQVGMEILIRRGKSPLDEIIAAVRQADSHILVVGRRLDDLSARILAEVPCHVLLAGAQARMWNRRLLIACDYRKDDTHMAELAAQIAKVTQTPMTILAIVNHDKEMDAAKADLDYRAGLMKLEGMSCDARVVLAAPGEIGETIVKFAQILDADLIIMGQNRSKGINRLVMGSMTEQVIADSPCAVLIVKPESALAHPGQEKT
jgi:SulP family sulfate permease